MSETSANSLSLIPKTERSYTLYYSQPKIARVEPHNVIRENKEEHFNACDDTEATRIMCEFLGQGLLELRTGTHSRTCIRLIDDDPYRKVRDYYPGQKLGLTGS